jgi:hypothetical protein
MLIRRLINRNVFVKKVMRRSSNLSFYLYFVLVTEKIEGKVITVSLNY